MRSRQGREEGGGKRGGGRSGGEKRKRAKGPSILLQPCPDGGKGGKEKGNAGEKEGGVGGTIADLSFLDLLIPCREHAGWKPEKQKRKGEILTKKKERKREEGGRHPRSPRELYPFNPYLSHPGNGREEKENLKRKKRGSRSRRRQSYSQLYLSLGKGKKLRKEKKGRGGGGEVGSQTPIWPLLSPLPPACYPGKGKKGLSKKKKNERETDTAWRWILLYASLA